MYNSYSECVIVYLKQSGPSREPGIVEALYGNRIPAHRIITIILNTCTFVVASPQRLYWGAVVMLTVPVAHSTNSNQKGILIMAIESDITQ